MAAPKHYIKTQGQLARTRYVEGCTVLKFFRDRLIWAETHPSEEEALAAIDAAEQMHQQSCEHTIGEYAKLGRTGDDVPEQFRLDPPLWTWRLATDADITETK